ncbi:FAD-linked oxidase C-terminal domain-containing protein [Mesoterricola silvestris]|uniref:FAD-binding protein n=1 Tax=Mesoterricola silvestris TaxID=2927979 RepID=A0AA48K7R6_9BACT|nr:FAD-linked oxidase C-terminal domain-containing protein [Mesoterricola silvestris]BDU71390.1 FAD-binding protein [Mesoterricola silvestris]
MSEHAFIRDLREIVGRTNVLASAVDLQLYQYDGYLEEHRPEAVVFVESTEEVARVVQACNRHGKPFVPRGGGTNLTGGTVPFAGGVVIEMIRMNRVLEIDVPNLRARAQPGLFNLELGNALAPLGYQYIPDPASQKAATLGGNVAENAGGPHCFKYGVTSNHVLGLTVVLPDGRVETFGGKAADTPGLDLTGLFVGSEGTLGICTEVLVKIVRQAEGVKTLLAIYDSIEEGSETVSAIVAAGMVPATLEMMDQLVIHAVEASLHCGLPMDCATLLLIEVDGLKDDLESQAAAIGELCKAHGAREVRVAKDDAERALLWAGRRGAFGAVARLAPSFLVCDGTVPRTALPQVLKKVAEVAGKYDLRIPNVFHAGDGNLHPLILFDWRDADMKARVLKAGMEILTLCAELGGTISGEHGVGLEKLEAMRLVMTEADIQAQRRVKAAFDPANLSNPGKMFPAKEVACER